MCDSKTGFVGSFEDNRVHVMKIVEIIPYYFVEQIADLFAWGMVFVKVFNNSVDFDIVSLSWKKGTGDVPWVL